MQNYNVINADIPIPEFVSCADTANSIRRVDNLLVADAGIMILLFF